MAKKSLKSGVFITFEGSEGCGKSTQAGLFYDYLKSSGYNAVFIREPGGTAIGEQIRGILLDNRNAGMTRGCELLLYMAARAQIVGEIVIPQLKQGCVVICDRYLDSTLAYQGYGLGMDLGVINSIGKFSTEGLKPDMTILLDLPVQQGLKHRAIKGDRIERRPLNYHHKVRRGYLQIAKAHPERVKVVKVAQDKQVTQQRIRSAAQAVLQRAGRC